jgi:UPF0755 protein
MKLWRLCALGLLAGLLLAGAMIYQLTAPYAAFGKETFVEVPRGATVAQIAVALEKAGVVRNAWAFRLARVVYKGRTLQAGEYRFTKRAAVVDVFERIARGDVYFIVLAVPEGKNIFDIGALAEQAGLFSAADFVAEARDPALIRDLDPDAPTLEGYLFPSTYHLNRHITPRRLCQMMTARFREVWQGLKAGGSVHRIVTLASLVEKEGKLAEERPKIAQVFQKRLRMGMKLDCDPTTIYAALLENRYRGVIHRSDLESEHAYNTYRHAGLPPGPIANPGLASIRAVLHPAETEYLFFVKRPDASGGHAFSETMAAHEANTAKFRTGGKAPEKKARPGKRG